MRLDEIESAFRSAVKDRFRYREPTLARTLLISDLDDDGTAALRDRVAAMLATAHGADLEWTVARDVAPNDLFGLLEAGAPDLIVCYRHVLTSGKGLIHSLGSVVDTVTQATDIPVLLVPSPESGSFDSLPRSLDRVLVVTDHLTGADRLVSWGAFSCAENGHLYLAHIEDDATYDRYIDVISKLKGLDTELATTAIRDKLLQLPSDYIAGVAAVLAEQGIHEHVTPLVRMGHPLGDYKALLAEHEIDLLVANSKDERQLAMAAMAYAIAVEIRDRPLLLL